MSWLAILTKAMERLFKAVPTMLAFILGQQSVRKEQAENTNETLKDIEEALHDDTLRADVHESLLVREDDDG